MSQTETLLLILVGFSIGALIFLFLARALWRAGVRLGARRSQRKVPSNVAELRSERDSLRGDYARVSQKLNARLEQTRLDMAEQMAEVSRHRNRLASMTIDLNERDAEIEDQRRRLAALDAELTEKSARMSEIEEELTSSNTERALQQTELAKLRTQIANLEASQADREPPAGHDSTTVDRLQHRIQQLSGLSQTIAAERNALQSADQESIDPLLQEKLEAVTRETADLKAELDHLDAAWAAKLGEIVSPDQGQISNRPRAVANVVNLAQRIRALQKNLAR